MEILKLSAQLKYFDVPKYSKTINLPKKPEHQINLIQMNQRKEVTQISLIGEDKCSWVVRKPTKSIDQNHNIIDPSQRTNNAKIKGLKKESHKITTKSSKPKRKKIPKS